MAYGRAQTANNRGNAGDRGIILGYYDDPDNPGPTEVTVKDLGGNEVKNNNNNTSGVKTPTSITYPYAPDPKDAKVNNAA